MSTVPLCSTLLHVYNKIFPAMKVTKLTCFSKILLINFSQRKKMDKSLLGLAYLSLMFDYKHGLGKNGII